MNEGASNAMTSTQPQNVVIPSVIETSPRGERAFHMYSLLLRERSSEALRSLRPRDARVVRLYYGLQGEESHTLEQIGKLLGVTRERVRQLRDRALRELKEGAEGAADGGRERVGWPGEDGQHGGG